MSILTISVSDKRQTDYNEAINDQDMVPVYVTKDGSDPIIKTIIINYNLACVKSPKMFKNKMCKLKICSQNAKNLH